MLSSLRRSSVLTLVVALLASFTVVALGPVSSAEAAPKPYCKKTKTKGDLVYYKCLTSMKVNGRKFIAGYRDSVKNGTNKTISATCTSSTSKTVTWGVSSSVSTEAGFIFAHASIKVEGSFSKSVQSGYTTSATFKVPAKKTRYCDRGVVQYNVSGHLAKQYCSKKSSRCHIYSEKNFKGHAPTISQWVIR